MPGRGGLHLQRESESSGVRDNLPDPPRPYGLLIGHHFCTKTYLTPTGLTHTRDTGEDNEALASACSAFEASSYFTDIDLFKADGEGNYETTVNFPESATTDVEPSLKPSLVMEAAWLSKVRIEAIDVDDIMSASAYARTTGTVEWFADVPDYLP